MRCFPVVFALVTCSAACVRLGLPSDADAGSEDAAAAGTAGTSSAATGTNCGVDPSTGVSLCLGSSLCPSVRVEADQFPDCGYRISGKTIDLECLCGDVLCPIGTAATCADARALLREQSAQGVCAAVAEGRCTVVRQTSPEPGATPGCDSDCRSQCSGVPGCLQLCGC